jgi:hypothetical protein
MNKTIKKIFDKVKNLTLIGKSVKKKEAKEISEILKKLNKEDRTKVETFIKKTISMTQEITKEKESRKTEDKERLTEILTFHPGNK